MNRAISKVRSPSEIVPFEGRSRPLSPTYRFGKRWVLQSGGLIGLWVAAYSFFDSVSSGSLVPTSIPTLYAVPAAAILVGLVATLAEELVGVVRQTAGLGMAETVDHPQIIEDVTSQIEASYKERKWDVVLRFGRVMIRPLWIAGRYQSLTKLGEMMETAASSKGSAEDQITALIDPLGWTTYKLGKIDFAVKNIKHGLRIAEEHKMSSLAYKAYRHLAGIAIDRGDLIESDENICSAVRMIDVIKDKKEKKSAEAGILLTKGLLSSKKGLVQESLEYFLSSRKMFKDLRDEERYVKLFQYIAESYMKLGNPNEALDAYRKGVDEAVRIQRSDAIIANALGAAELYENGKEGGRASECYFLAADACSAMGLAADAQLYRNKAMVLIRS